ncbi:MAG: T9SS type A sorting domain-containing protein [Phaeodactylibacter sp.]|nr:T9SS type A sorting domain-containing protein [Phaeodactylibacter sp.]
MRAFKWVAILFFVSQGGFSSAAQPGFTATPEVVTAVKPSDIFVFYNYTQFGNLTGDTLQMRWVRTEVAASNRSATPGTGPMGNWAIAIQDPNAYYNPANGLDSADFYLPPATGSTDHFILQLFPNNEAGNLIMKFRFFPVANPADSLTVTFDFTATPAMTSTIEQASDAVLSAYPNPAPGRFFIRNLTGSPSVVTLFSPRGEALRRHVLMPGEEAPVDGSGLPAGNYYLRAEAGDRLYCQRVVFYQ